MLDSLIHALRDKGSIFLTMEAAVEEYGPARSRKPERKTQLERDRCSDATKEGPFREIGQHLAGWIWPGTFFRVHGADARGPCEDYVNPRPRVCIQDGEKFMQQRCPSGSSRPLARVRLDRALRRLRVLECSLRSPFDWRESA